MFIQSEATPNPETLKFLPGEDVMGEGTANYTAAEQAGQSPLATRLFATDGVQGVFLGSDFVTVTKTADRDWGDAQALRARRNHGTLHVGPAGR